jgi:HEAT repeats
MVWSNWQGAIWRGAMLVLLFWTGLAWTQTGAPGPNSADKIMVVHENGRSTRCRVMETWQLPDGRVAQLLQAVETGEMITIVDEPNTNPDVKNARAMPKRIFTWGEGRRTAPEGSPIPPHLQLASGVVIRNETPPPNGTITEAGPVIVNQDVVVQDGKNRPGLIGRLLGKKEMGESTPQMVEFGNSPSIVQVGQATPGLPQIPHPVPAPYVVEPTPIVEVPAPAQGIQPVVSQPMDITPNVNVGPVSVQPQPVVCESTRPVETVTKRWYPGANIQAWLQSRSTPKVQPAKIEIVKVDDANKLQIADDPSAQKKAEDAKKLKQAEDLLAQQNKVADKQLANRIEGITKAPYSTAMGSVPPPEYKKPEPTPLAIANPTDPEKQIVLPPTTPKEEGVKSAPMAAEKRDMWGNQLATPIPSPGKSLIEGPAPFSRPNDPLMAPERLMTAGDPKTKAMVSAPPPRPEMGPSASNLGPSSPYPLPPREGQPVNWPLGTQSVQAAHSGLAGQPMYIPVPTVTVPQPQHPPGPPMPQGLEAPNLNAYVNAFTPPPVPKGAAMAQQGNYPMMSQQQMMMQQQMMAQQQMAYQQQLMMQYGYRPTPAMMNPYLPQAPAMAQSMPSQGPMTNGSRQYAGPMPPANPFSPGPAMQTGYAPSPYPPMMPQQTMMQQQPPMTQQASFQQPAAPTQQQSVSQQVDQLIRALRENPYPAQREWAAQSLTNFEWRAHPQIVPALLQSASQDPAASVRAGSVYCLGRMNAAVEPVFGTLRAMRNDIDPRVRAEVEQAITRLGQN